MFTHIAHARKALHFKKTCFCEISITFFKIIHTKITQFSKSTFKIKLIIKLNINTIYNTIYYTEDAQPL